jgi:glutathione S-transferase
MATIPGEFRIVRNLPYFVVSATRVGELAPARLPTGTATHPPIHWLAMRSTPHLYVGNRNYSSWSLRPWLCLRWAAIEFDETSIELDQPGYGEGRVAAVCAVSPSGRVPVLTVGNLPIWDSLSIAEWANENSRAGPLWPTEPLQRAQARSVSAEIHAGFFALRNALPMNIRRRCTAYGLAPDTLADISRIGTMWASARASHRANGPYLFGARCIADAFSLPIATRFRTYGVDLPGAAQSYCETLLVDPAFLEWEARVLAEPVRVFSRATLDAIYADPSRDYTTGRA